MSNFRPKYISFDCYGTLIRFHMSEMARDFFADRLPAEAMDEMCRRWLYTAVTRARSELIIAGTYWAVLDINRELAA